MKRIVLLTICLAGYLAVLTGCSPAGKYRTVNGVVMGYSFKIVYQAPSYVPWTFESDIRRAARRCTQEIDRSLSLYHRNSIINNINNNKDLKTDTIFETVLLKAKEVSELTGAFLNTTTGPLQDLWGYNMSNYQHVSAEEIAKVLDYTGLWRVHLKEGFVEKEDPRIRLNLNALGIGYAADYLADMLERNQVVNYMIEVGKVVKCKGVNPAGTPWRIQADQASNDVIYLTDKAMSIYGSLFNFRVREGKIFNNLFNAKTGYPIEDPLLSTLIVSGNCLDAAAYSVSFYSMGLEQSISFLESHSDIQAILFYYQDDQIKTHATTNITPRNEIQYFP